MPGSPRDAASGELRTGWYDDTVRLRRWCGSMPTRPSVGEPSGERLSDADRGLLADDGDAESPCSVASAVVATAFALLPDVPANGMRPAEKREDVDRRDAREPGRRGRGTGAVPPCATDVCVCVGDGGGGACGGVGLCDGDCDWG